VNSTRKTCSHNANRFRVGTVGQEFARIEYRAPMASLTSKRRWALPTAIVLALVVVAAGLAAWLWRPSTTSTTPSDLVMPMPYIRPEGGFVDFQHGYLLLGQCPVPADQECQAWVGVTDDGGASWRTTMVPGLTFSQDRESQAAAAISVIPLDADHAVVEQRDRRWQTGDGGRSWTHVDPTIVETIDEIPQGAYVYVTLAEGPQPSAMVVRMVRLDGTSAVLAARPTADHPLDYMGTLTWTPDGNAWITPNSDGYPAFFRSQDRGRTWEQVALPDGLPVEGRTYRFIPASGATVYLTDHEAFRLWRSNDSGMTWEELTVGFDSAGAPVGPWEHGLPDGRFVASKPIPTDAGTRFEQYVITPTGSTFEPFDHPSILATTAVFLREPTNKPRAPWGVWTPEGGWTPLPFGCTGLCF